MEPTAALGHFSDIEKEGRNWVYSPELWQYWLGVIISKHYVVKVNWQSSILASPAFRMASILDCGLFQSF